MSETFDVIILGLGANGSSAAYHLSKTGNKILGIDQFRPPHTHGSSHGQSRIIRQAYYESPLYVPFLKKAYNLWYDIEDITGKKLFLKTGGLMLGSESSQVVKGARLSATSHDIPFEYLDHNDIKKRFPALNPSPGTYGVLEKHAGILFPEDCIKTYLEEAEKNGAILRYDERVTSIINNENFIEIVTDEKTYRAAKLIISAGAWLSELMPELHLPLTIERQVLYWLKDANEKPGQYFMPDKLPVYIWEYLPGKMFYGFPDLGDGIKIAFSNPGEHITPDSLISPAAKHEINSIMAIAGKYLDIKPVFNYAVTCKYTNTPDEDFIIDVHPKNKNIIIASPCSGHGFKFSSVTGKILCDLAIGNPVLFDLSPFSISRFE